MSPSELSTKSDQTEAQLPAYSDEALARRFAAVHCDNLRYVAGLGRWFVWRGSSWQMDNTLEVLDFARRVCSNAAAECAQTGHPAAYRNAAKIASAATVAAVEKLAKSDRRLAATVGQWDCHPLLLNTPCGTIDLQTGDLLPHQRSHYLTKITAVGPEGKCLGWLAFLDRITNGDKQLQNFLQHMAGYALTGSTSEHALFFLYGTGANGKSVFLNTIVGILGDYAVTAPIDTFIASNSDRHPTDLAGLQGARLVAANETEEGRRWNETKIKSLTGGDRISARFMRQDFFQYTPQFKLLIAGNHKPGLRGVDEAMRRRMNLIPFTVTIPEEERDQGLFAKLKEEWAGILQWMVDGALDWAGEGLVQPEAVRAATAEYIESEDALALWQAECCMEGKNRYSMVADLFASWKRWAESAGEYVGSQKRFSQALRDRGFHPRKQGGTGRAGFEGLSLKATSDDTAM